MLLGHASSEQGCHGPSEVAAHLGFVEEPAGKSSGLSIGRFLGGRSGYGQKCDDDEDSHGFTF